jgi:hypothetical protein
MMIAGARWTDELASRSACSVQQRWRSSTGLRYHLPLDKKIKIDRFIFIPRSKVNCDNNRQ